MKKPKPPQYIVQRQVWITWDDKLNHAEAKFKLVKRQLEHPKGKFRIVKSTE